MTTQSEDSDSVYSRETSQVRSSLTASSLTSPSSSEVILGGKSITARRLSPQSTLFGTSGAWSLQQDSMKNRPSRDGGIQSRQARHRMGTVLSDMDESSCHDKSDAEMLGEMFTSVNSGLQVKFPESPETQQKKKEQTFSRVPQIKLHQANGSTGYKEVPPHASHYGLSQDINPTLLASGLLSTPPRKKKAELQSKFSTSPDARSSSARHAKIIKSKASQGRLRKVSTTKKEVQVSTPADSSIRGKLKPQSSIQGLKKLVGLTPGATRSKSSIATKHEEFPDSLRLLVETHAMQETDKIAAVLKDQKKAAGTFNSGRISPYMERERLPLPNLVEDEVLISKHLPPRPSISGANGEGNSFWRKIRSSTKPRESSETIRATSRCESRSTRRGHEEEEESVTNDNRRSRWWTRIRDNAAKIVGQREIADSQHLMSSGTLPRPSMVADDGGRRKASLDAAMALADCLVDENEVQSQVEKDLAMRLNSSKRRKRPPMPLLLLQGRQDGENGIEYHRPATSMAIRQETREDLHGPLSAPLVSQTAKERSGSKKNWLRPLQLTANLRSNGKLDNSISNGKGNQRLGKQSDSCLLQKTLATGSKVEESPPRTRLSVPALSSIKYKDTLPIPPRSRQSRASTISSMDSRTSLRDEGKNRDDYTQKTVGSSILYKDEEILRQQHNQYSLPPTISLPHPFPTSTSTTSLRAGYMREDDVTPREATDILYNLVSRFKNDGSPSTFRTASAVTHTIASSRLTPLHLSPEAARYIRGRRTTCTTLESILTYQSSTDYSESSFQSQNVGSLMDDSKHDSHLQTLIDGVLEDIEDLVNQSVTSSSKASQSQVRGTTAVSSQHSRSVSNSSLGSAHSKFEWPPKSASQESGQLRLLGAKLFSSAIEVAPLDSPCPPSRKKSLPLISFEQKKSSTTEKERQVIKDQIDFTHFKTDYVVGETRVPLHRAAFQQILEGNQQISPKTTMSGIHHNDTPSSSFLFSSQSPSIMGQSLISTASSPPSILIQRPLSDTSLSNCSMTTSPDSVIIGQAKVVCNRKSSASLMDLNDVLNGTRSRSTSFASSIQGEDKGQKKDAFEYDDPSASPDTAYSFTSSSQAWSERPLPHYASFEQRRQSYSTECTDISPESSISKGQYTKASHGKYIPFAIQEREDEEEDDHRDHCEYQEAMQSIEESQRCFPHSDYTRQILSIFTPPKTLKEVIEFLQESWETFNLLKGKMPSLMTICIVERQRDQKRNKRKSIPLPRWKRTEVHDTNRGEQQLERGNVQEEMQVKETIMENHLQDEMLDQVAELCELDESSIYVPTTPSRWSSITTTFDVASRYSYTSNESNGRISFRYFVQSPSTESHSHSTHHHYLYR